MASHFQWPACDRRSMAGDDGEQRRARHQHERREERRHVVLEIEVEGVDQAEGVFVVEHVTRDRHRRARCEHDHDRGQRQGGAAGSIRSSIGSSSRACVNQHAASAPAVGRRRLRLALRSTSSIPGVARAAHCCRVRALQRIQADGPQPGRGIELFRTRDLRGPDRSVPRKPCRRDRCRNGRSAGIE